MPSRWANVRALLEPALDPEQPFTWSDVEARLNDGSAKLWWIPGAAMVTEFADDAIHVWLGGGDLHGLLRLRPIAEGYGAAMGMKRATINGRLGWDRVLRRFGYVRRGEELEKRL